MRKKRDDFSPATKELIAKRSGYICAYPGCRRFTIGKSNDRSSGVTNIGVAAHITAASESGPRYDASMSPDERASERNGIWTCQIHGKLIDDNPSKCTVEQLLRWKSQHEEWIFKRVEAGRELYHNGITQICFNNLGVFTGEFKIPFGKHNILVGPTDSGKTTFCEIISAFSGKDHWIKFNKRFNFSKRASKKTFIEMAYFFEKEKINIRISPQFVFPKKKSNNVQRLLVEINECISPYMPTSLPQILLFDSQLYRTHYKDPKDTFIKALKYLSNIFQIDEEFIWSILRDDMFSKSIFGYKFNRIGRRKTEVLVPNGREFYLPHTSLSFTEKQYALLDITLKLIISNPNHKDFLLIFDIPFFSRMDRKNKINIFNKLTSLNNIQTLFCVNSDADIELLKNENIDKWVNALQVGNMTMHSFL